MEKFKQLFKDIIIVLIISAVLTPPAYLTYYYFKIPVNAEIYVPNTTESVAERYLGLEDSNLYNVSVRSIYTDKRSDFVKFMWEMKSFYTKYVYVELDELEQEELIDYFDEYVSDALDSELEAAKSMDEIITDRYGESKLNQVSNSFLMDPFTLGDSATLVNMLAAIGIHDNKSWLHSDQKVVITGSLDAEGNVLPVGMVDLKALTAKKSNADIFIVPKTQEEEAYKYLDKKTSLTIVGVETIEETIDWMEKNVY